MAETATTTAERTLVHYQAREGVAYLTLDDPPANTYTHEMMRQLDDAILSARFDKEVYVLVLAGKGEKFFCAGANINMLKTADEELPEHRHASMDFSLVQCEPRFDDNGGATPIGH